MFVKKLHQGSRIHIIYHNAKFDLAMLLGNKWLEIDDIDPDRIQDTLILSFLMNPIKSREFGNGSHGLKHLYKEHLQEDGEEDQPEYQEIGNGRSFEDAEFNQAKFYATFDAYSTYHLFNQIFKPALENDKALNHYYSKIERPHIITTIEIIMTGMRLLPQSTALAAGSPTAMNNLEQAFQCAKEQLFTLARRTFRFASPDDFRSVMFGRLTEIKTKKRGKAQGKPLIDKDTLIEIFALSKNLYQKAITSIAIYAKHLDITIRKHTEMYDAINQVTDRVHANIRVTTSSGRFSSPSPNILSLGKGSKIKEHIVPRDGWGFVVADFSQIDLRAIANETGGLMSNSKMLEDVNAGKDLHFNTLGIIDDKAREKIDQGWNKLAKDGKSVTLLNTQIVALAGEDEKLAQRLVKDRSNLAKKINFGVSYGLGATNLYDTLMKHDKALDEIVDFPKNHLVLPEWVSDLSQKAMQADYRQKTWIDRAATILASHQDLASWIQKIEDKIIVKELDIETVEGYLDMFYQEYKEIKQFQVEVEKDLVTYGTTYNVFGRLCRGELYGHMLAQSDANKIKFALDLRLPNGEWYRLFISPTGIDRKGINCRIEVAFRLFMKQTSKFNPKPIDHKIENAQLIYHIKPEAWHDFENVRLFANDPDTFKICLNKIHADADWDTRIYPESRLVSRRSERRGLEEK
ncbi:MAG: DNA polymerase [Proteobacteria bacterium]|nr:DNA polymerase [Pseudomonadota bacterium]